LGVLPDHLRQAALFCVNTGLRNTEVCNIMWDYEIEIPELRTSVFLIPKERVKNRQDRLVVLNTIAQEVVEMQRGQHSQYVFAYK